MSEDNKEQLNDDGTPIEPKLRQDDVSNDMTRKILERNDVKTTTQDVKKAEGEEGAVKPVEPADAKDEQVVKQEQTVALTEDDIVALETAGISEESLDGKTVEEIKVIAQDASKKQGVDEASQDQPTVSEDDALKAGGFAGNLIGKTPAELLEIINNQNSFIGEQGAKLSSTKPVENKSVDSLNQQNLSTEDVDKDTDEKSVDLLSLTPEDQSKQLSRIIKKEVDAGVKEGLDNSPEMIAAREQDRVNRMTEFHTSLGEKLPEDIKTPEQAKEVFDNWTKVTKDQYTIDDLKALAKTPNVLITLISDHYRINNKETKVVKKDDDTTKAVKKVESKSYQRMRSMIKDAPSGESKFNFKRKAVEDNESDLLSTQGDDSQQMIGRILNRHLQ